MQARQKQPEYSRPASFAGWQPDIKGADREAAKYKTPTTTAVLVPSLTLITKPLHRIKVLWVFVWFNLDKVAPLDKYILR